jgi:hypothetical protein
VQQLILHLGVLMEYIYFINRFTVDDVDINFLSLSRCFISCCGTMSHPVQRTFADNLMDVFTDNKILPCEIQPIRYWCVTMKQKDIYVTYLFIIIFEHVNEYWFVLPMKL